MNNQYDVLFTPYNIGKLTIKNRFVLSPMATWQFSGQGMLNDSGENYYVERAKGGFGLLYTGNMISDLEIDPFNMNERFSPLASPKNFTQATAMMNERIHAYGAKIFGQVTMGNGRMMIGNKSCSDNPSYYNMSQGSGELTHDEIKRKIEFVVKAAQVVKRSGFDGVEVHALHWGYLLDQFAMAITNHRTDEYGGTLENRLRVTREILEGIKQTCGSDYPVSIRLGLKSFMTGLGPNHGSFDGSVEVGRTQEEGIRIAKELESYGFDVLNCNIGQYESMYYGAMPMYMPKGFSLPYAAAVKKEVNIPVLINGRMNDPELCKKAIEENMADGIVLGRASLADPYFPKKLEMGTPEKIRPCISCNEGCIKRMFSGGRMSCAVNPTAMRELEYGITKAVTVKNVVIIGGGVGGMEVARTAALRGHRVTLIEKSDHLGGHLVHAGKHDFKRDIADLNQWYQNELAQLHVDVRLNTAADAEMVKALQPDTVVFAVGGEVLMPKSISGIDHPKAVSCVDALEEKKPIGDKVVVVGGGLVGCEIAMDCVKHGKTVTVVEGLDDILSAGAPVPFNNEYYIRDFFKYYNVELKTGCMLKEVNDAGVVITHKNDGAEEVVPADTAVLSIGFRANPSFEAELRGTGIELYSVSAPNGIGNIIDSVWKAYEIARNI